MSGLSVTFHVPRNCRGAGLCTEELMHAASHSFIHFFVIVDFGYPDKCISGNLGGKASAVGASGCAKVRWVRAGRGIE